MSSDVSRRSSAVVGGVSGGGGGGGKKMRKRKELDALTGTVVGVNRNRRLMCSSDSDSCSSSRAPTPLKLRRQITRRRKRTFISNTWCSALRVFLTFGCIVWVVLETYTFLDIRKIQVHLQTQLDEVAAGNRGVPDDLQKCHTMSKQLQQNQTDINQRLSVYDGQIANITLQVNNLGSRLALIEKKINENKDLISSSDATKSVNVLPEVAKLGSNYRDLSDSVKSLKDITNSLKLYQTILSSNITSINEKLNNVGGAKTDEAKINNLSQNLQKQIDNLGSNMTKMNENVTSRIEWLTNDQKKHGSDIEKLKEGGQYLTSEIKTIESKFSNLFDNVDSKIKSLKTQTDMIASNVTNLHAQSKSNDSLTSSGQLKDEKNGNPTKS